MALVATLVMLAVLALTAGIVALGNGGDRPAPAAPTQPQATEQLGGLHYETTHAASLASGGVSAAEISAYTRAHDRHQRP